MTGEWPKTKKSLIVPKPLQLQGFGAEKEIVSLYAFWLQQSFLERKICAHVHYAWTLGDYKKDLRYDAYGLEVFFAIIQKYQHVNCSTACVLV